MAAMQLAQLMLPHLPSISLAALQHSVGLSGNSKHWDLRTEVTVHVLRIVTSGKLTNKPNQITVSQARANADPGVKGKTWVATAKIPKPAPGEESLREEVFKIIDAAQEDGKASYTHPDLVDLEVEWTGYRTGVSDKAPLPAVSEAEKYKRLMADPSRTSATTFLYFHGGAYYLCDPSTHRPLVTDLAKESGGRVCSVRYRLAPQTAFPGQLLDALLVYLSLLYPPPGSFYEPVPANTIVFGGDSAGGNLSFALLQLLLRLHKSANGSTPTLRFHGKDVEVPLPAGVSADSGWFDVLRALPSITNNAGFDYLPLPDHGNATARYAEDEAWPAKPPRGDVFCDLSVIDNPLTTLVLAESWAGAPPLWMCTGQEMLTDEDLLVASRAVQQGVTVHLEQYEAMPHVFQMLIPHLKTSQRCVKSWATWARKCVEQPASLTTNGTWISSKGGKEVPMDVAGASQVTYDEAKRLIREAKQKRIEGWNNGNTFPKPAL